MKLLILFFFSIICYSCNPELKDERHTYFNARDFFQKEAERLKNTQSLAVKKVFLNGKTETQNLEIHDWQRELESFAEADISKRSFIGKYHVDTIFVNNQKELHYKALDKNLNIKNFTVFYDSLENPNRIRIFQENQNTLYTSSRQMEYNIRSGYKITGRQSVRFFQPDSFAVEVNFMED